MYKELKNEDLAYIAGFLDGDGCILTQIVKRKDYKYKHTIRFSIVFYQKKNNHWFLIWLQKKINKGNIRIRKDNMAELCILGSTPVKELLVLLMPYLVIKKNLAKLVIDIIENVKNVSSEASFIEVCKLVDKTAEYTYSKKRTITAITVQETFKLPVETVEFIETK
jgi:hypothetical protein